MKIYELLSIAAACLIILVFVFVGILHLIFPDKILTDEKGQQYVLGYLTSDCNWNTERRFIVDIDEDSNGIYVIVNERKQYANSQGQIIMKDIVQGKCVISPEHIPIFKNQNHIFK